MYLFQLVAKAIFNIYFSFMFQVIFYLYFIPALFKLLKNGNYWFSFS